MRFQDVDKWFIVYDTTKDRSYTHRYVGHPKIVEVDCSDPGLTGNPQRNLGISMVKDGFLFFLDDDNIIHPDFWTILPTLQEDYFYTWDQENALKGEKIELEHIDTSMFIVPKKICKNLKWKPDERWYADYLFIKSIYDHYPEKHIYIPKSLCYYNKLR
jgi:hypothetical protein